MTPIFTYLNTALFVVLPYVALFTFFLVTIQRYRTRPFTYSSQSSQFLENRQHFWALVPFHYGIIVVLTGHVVAFFIPRQILAWNSHPLRLYVLEVSALVFGLLSVVGLVAIVVRRVSDAKVKIVTSMPDWVVLGLLLVQIVGGVLVAVHYPLGHVLVRRGHGSVSVVAPVAEAGHRHRHGVARARCNCTSSMRSCSSASFRSAGWFMSL